MKKIALSFMAISFLATSYAEAASAPPAPPINVKCASPNAGGCKSRARKFAIAKAKCEELTDEAKKEECLKALEKKPEDVLEPASN